MVAPPPPTITLCMFLSILILSNDVMEEPRTALEGLSPLKNEGGHSHRGPKTPQYWGVFPFSSRHPYRKNGKWWPKGSIGGIWRSKWTIGWSSDDHPKAEGPIGWSSDDHPKAERSTKYQMELHLVLLWALGWSSDDHLMRPSALGWSSDDHPMVHFDRHILPFGHHLPFLR